MIPLILNLIGGALLLLCAVHLFRVILTKISNFWDGWFWLAPTSILLLGLERFVTPMGPTGTTIGPLLLIPGAALLTVALWHWAPPAWWEQMQQNERLKKQIEARRRMADEAMERMVQTKRRLGEMELMEERLTERMHKALHASGNAVLVLNLDGTVVRWEPAAEQMFGFKGSEVEGKPLQAVLSEEWRQKSWPAVWGQLTDSRSRARGRWIKLRGRRRAGAPFPFEAYLMKTAAGGGKSYYFTLLRDLSEIEALNHAVESYRQLVVKYRSQLREKERTEGLIQHRLTLLRQALRRLRPKASEPEHEAPPSPPESSSAPPAPELTPVTVRVDDLKALAAEDTDTGTREAAWEAIDGLVGNLLAGQPQPRAQAEADSTPPGDSAGGGIGQAATPAPNPADGGPTATPPPPRGAGAVAEGGIPEGPTGEEFVVFNSIGPAKYILVETFGKQTRYRKPKGMSLMLLHHGENLVISVGHYLGRMPTRAVIPLSALTLRGKH